MMSLPVTLGVGLLLAVVPTGKAPQPQAVNKPATQQPAVQHAQAQRTAAKKLTTPKTAQASAAPKATARAPIAPKSTARASAAPKATARAPLAPKSTAQASAAKNPTSQAPAAPKSIAKAPAPQAPAAKPAGELHPVEAGILARTNAQRARYGLRPLKLDFGLQNSARRHAQWMSRNRTMQHTSAAVAENIAMGQNSSQEAVNSWMNSSGHRANILNSGYSRIGVAAYRTPQGTTFWCQQFMR